MRTQPASPCLRAAKKKLAENPGAMFGSVISEEEVNKPRALLAYTWRERIFSPLVTLWTFLGQVLNADSSCRDAVARRAERASSVFSDPRGLDRAEG